MRECEGVGKQASERASEWASEQAGGGGRAAKLSPDAREHNHNHNSNSNNTRRPHNAFAETAAPKQGREVRSPPPPDKSREGG